MSTNQETERDTLVGLVTANLVGAGKSLQAAYGYQEVADWAGENKQSPVMVISSGSVGREPDGAGDYDATFGYHADIFVLFEDGTWTAAECEDRINLIEYEFFALLKANSSSTKKYRYDGVGRYGSAVVGGEEFRRLRIPVAVYLPNG